MKVDIVRAVIRMSGSSGSDKLGLSNSNSIYFENSVKEGFNFYKKFRKIVWCLYKIKLEFIFVFGSIDFRNPAVF